MLREQVAVLKHARGCLNVWTFYQYKIKQVCVQKAIGNNNFIGSLDVHCQESDACRGVALKQHVLQPDGLYEALLYSSRGIVLGRRNQA